MFEEIKTSEQLRVNGLVSCRVGMLGRLMNLSEDSSLLSRIYTCDPNLSWFILVNPFQIACWKTFYEPSETNCVWTVRELLTVNSVFATDSACKCIRGSIWYLLCYCGWRPRENYL